MRIVVVSDSHKRVATLFDIIEKHMNDADLFIFLGDIDSDFDEVVSVYPNLKYKRVAGNNEWYSSRALTGLITVNGRRIFYCHGHTLHVKHGYEEIKNYARSVNADICLFGHTHTQFSDYDDGLYVMNPGAARNGEYGIVDIVSNGIMLIKSKI